METEINPLLYELKLRRREGKISSRFTLFLDGVLTLMSLPRKRLFQWKDKKGGGIKSLAIWAAILTLALISVWLVSMPKAKKTYDLEVVSYGNVAVEIYAEAKKEDLYLARGEVLQALLAIGFHALNPEKYDGTIPGIARETFFKCQVHPRRKIIGFIVFDWECGRDGHPKDYRHGTESTIKELAARLRDYSDRALPVMRSVQTHYLT